MIVIAFDTTTETLAVAAARGDDWVAHSCNSGLKHATLLAPLIEQVTGELGVRVAEVDLVAVGIGPGSFTGVRIGVATAKGIAAAGRARLAGICGLDAMAWDQRHAGGLVVPLIDARKRRFYAACYRDGRRVGPYLDQAPAALAETVRATAAAGEPVLLTGPAAAQFAAALQPAPAEREGAEQLRGDRLGTRRRSRDPAAHSTEQSARTAAAAAAANAGSPGAGWRIDRRPAQVPVLAMLDLAERNLVATPADLKPLYLRRSEAELGITAPDR
ncbi:MAG: tRNA (adenosine(37)-N6)-threonylcarbamoyltransferase complex dimerization subunit type 1 TsaB [Spirochaetaceae bacterium]|nr:tRNA (adenosine(37)-N6)-threonylcarbamoyltransferase complex dimerization subunit type 1 TsaB [Spirochaetaceae bacterium]